LNGTFRLHRLELLEWATLGKLPVPAGLLANGDESPPPRLDTALEQGGILHGVAGADRPTVLRAVVQRLALPADCDRDLLLHMLLCREAHASTAIGNGLAIPHPRYPVVLPLASAAITIAFLDQPIAYQSADSQPVHTLFVLICPTVRLHLQLLARLATALRERRFASLIQRKAGGDAIVAQARELEESHFHVTEEE
jgi:PTS system nitrogen regulatory IIA component